MSINSQRNHDSFQMHKTLRHVLSANIENRINKLKIIKLIVTILYKYTLKNLTLTTNIKSTYIMHV